MTDKKLRSAAAVLVSSMLLSACFGDSPEQYLATAKNDIAKNDSAAAVIHLKNALQANPQLHEARYLLAEMLYASGDIAGADIEAGKLTEAAYTNEKLIPLRARLMLAHGKNEALLSEFASVKLASDVAMADLLASRAVAYGLSKRFQEGQDAIEQSLKLQAGNPRARLIRVRLLSAAGKADEALAAVEETLAQAPKNSEAWQLKAELLSRAGKRDEAIEAFKQSAAGDKRNFAAYAGALDLLIAKGDVAGAAPQLKSLRAVAPKNPITYFYGASLAMTRGDLNEAHDEILKVLAVAPAQERVLLLAGIIELKRGAFLEASNYLTKLLTANPEHADARKLLAQTQLRQDDPAKALSTLQPLLASGKPGIDTLKIVAEAYLRLGDVKRAQAMFAQIAHLNPTDVRAGIALALADVDQGKRDSGIAGLRKIAEEDPSPAADLALLNTFMAKRDFDNALKAVDGLQKKLPEKAVALNLRGRIELSRGNTEAARSQFEAATKADAAYYPAVASLVWLDALNSNFGAAEARLNKFIALQPNSEPANMALVTLRGQAGASDEVLADMLKKLIGKMPNEASPRLALIGIQLRQNDAKLALATAQEATAALPTNAEAWAALGNVQSQLGAFDQAVAAYNKQIALRPNAPDSYMPLAGLYASKKDLGASARVLGRALAVKSDFIPAQAALATIAISKGDFAEARRIALQVQSQHPTDAVGTTMLADVEANQKHWDVAAASYREALGKGGDTEVAVKQYMALRMAGKPAAAAKAADEWLAAHPRDLKFLFHVGDSALIERDWATAEQRYRALLAIAPASPAALNNMAWALLNGKKPGALEYAEKATKLAPKQPAFLDTLAKVHASEGRFDKAIEVQKRALELDPKSVSYRLNLGRYYLSAGQKSSARQELQRVADSAGSGVLQSEAKKLLATL